MKKYIPHLIILAIAILIGLSAYYYGKSKAKVEIEYKEIKVIEKQIDTVRVEIVKIEEKIIYKEKERKRLKEEEKNIIFNEEECKEIVDNLRNQLYNCDEIVVYKDSIIEKERIVIEYKDNIIEKMVIPKPKPFGVGVQIGATTNFKEVQPYIGVGVSYNLIRF